MKTFVELCRKLSDVKTKTNAIHNGLKRMTCNSEAQKLFGMPCPHTIAAIHIKDWDPYDHVDMYYNKVSFMKLCDNILEPINGDTPMARSFIRSYFILQEHTNSMVCQEAP